MGGVASAGARGVSDIFVEMGPFLKSYSRYCEAYHAANQLLLRDGSHEYMRYVRPFRPSGPYVS